MREKSWGLTILRIGLGLIMIPHGMQKLFGSFGGPGLQNWAGMLGSMGFQPPMFWAVVGALVEFLGGIFLVFGFFTHITAILIAIQMLVAIVKVHLSKGFFSFNGGYEYALALFIMAICIALQKHSPLSLDSLWCRPKKEEAQ